ncbi:MAG: circadian clock protein KaiC [Rhodospirillaceae bacterium]
MTTTHALNEVVLKKTPVGIAGFDQIAHGGIPMGRTTLLAGTAGSGKTIFSLQFLVSGIEQFNENGVIVTFEESPEDLARNVGSLGWEIRRYIAEKRIALVDASPEPGETVCEAGPYDLSALLARIEHAVSKVGATRVILDSVGAIFPQFADSNVVRRELHRVVSGMRQLGVTSLITIERVHEYGEIARFGVEEFVADNVIILRNPLEQEKRRRTIEILKFRGTTHQKGEYPFTIDPSTGVTIIPLSAIELKQKSSNIRTSSGNADFDKMCGGGVFRDSIILVSGATGTGKTLMVSHFMKGGIEAGHRVILFAFEENREQLVRNATSWGVDFESAEEQGLLRIICRYPETMGLEDHLIQIQREIDRFKPTAIAIDSLSALERVSTMKSFREFVIALTSFIKHREIAGMFTNTTTMLMGGESITETHISTITDSIVLLRYVELQGNMHRAITVLKMRGSWHDKQIREYVVTDHGMEIAGTFHGIGGILTGSITYTLGEEREYLERMFSGGT